MPIRNSLLSKVIPYSWISRKQPKTTISHFPYLVYRQITMIPILRDSETLSLILEFILETPNGRRSIARLARTCKAFSEPALDILWRDLDSLSPLLSLLPGHLFKRAKRPGLGFVKLPEEGDWKKLLLYGQRVRKITYFESAGNISPSIFTALEDCRPQDFILPNLKSLVWRVETPEGLERSLLFLVPELHTLSIETGDKISPQEIEDFLGEVSTLGDLTALSITSSVKISDRLPRFLQPLTTFEKFSLMAPGALSPSVGKWLSNMPTLRTLQLEISSRSGATISAFFNPTKKVAVSSPDAVRTPDSGIFSGEELDSLSEKLGTIQDSTDSSITGFSNLRNLHLTGGVASVNTFLSHVKSPIQQLQLVLEETDDEADWRMLFSTVQRQFRKSLQTLDISPTGSSKYADMLRSTSRGDIAARRLPLDTLVSLPHLIRMEIDLPISTILKNEDIESLAMACPKIETLRLCHLSRWPTSSGPPKLTLGGLAPLTAECKHLHSLSIPIHAVEALDDALFDLKTSSRSLLHLHVGHSWVEDPLEAAILLSHLAPHLESLKWFHEKNRPGYSEASDLGWQKVSNVLTPLQRLQLRERRRIPQIVEKSEPKKSLTADKAVDATSSTITLSKGIQVKVSAMERGVEARPQVKHKNITAQPQYTSQIIDATLQLCHKEVNAIPAVADQNSQTEPVVQVNTPNNLSENNKNESVMAAMEMDESDSNLKLSNYHRSSSIFSSLGNAVWYTFHALRSVSPVFVVRLFDMLPLVNFVNEQGNLSR